PVGSFIFLGPTGVGKTELARSLANFLFGSDSALIRFDMSEYMEKHSVSKLIGSPPGYVGHEEGGQLTEKVKRNPYSVVLLDEIIVFEALTDDDLRRITGLLIDQLNVNLADRRMKINVTAEVIDWIIENTLKDRSYGARPLRRAIQRHIEDPLSEELIRGHLRDGEIDVFVDAGQLAYRSAGELTAGRHLK